MNRISPLQLAETGRIFILGSNRTPVNYLSSDYGSYGRAVKLISIEWRIA
jgi:hypothetical protein